MFPQNPKSGLTRDQKCPGVNTCPPQAWQGVCWSYRYGDITTEVQQSQTKLLQGGFRVPNRPEPIVWKGVFFWMVAARVRVPGSSPFSQLNLHETDEAKVVFTKQKRSISVARPEKKRIKANSHFFYAFADRALGTVGHCYSYLVEEFSCMELCKNLGSFKKEATRTTQNQTKHQTQTIPTKKDTAEASRYVYGWKLGELYAQCHSALRCAPPACSPFL